MLGNAIMNTQNHSQLDEARFAASAQNPRKPCRRRVGDTGERSGGGRSTGILGSGTPRAVGAGADDGHRAGSAADRTQGVKGRKQGERALASSETPTPSGPTTRAVFRTRMPT